MTTRDIANILKNNGIGQINKNQVSLFEPIKALGIIDVKVNLHAEVSTIIKINVARTEEEAELQEKGKPMSPDDEQSDEDALVDVFDEGVEADVSDEIIETVIVESAEVAVEDNADSAEESNEVEDVETKE